MSEQGREKLSPLRIGIDVTAAITQGGGIGRFTRELVKAVVTSCPESSFQLFSARPRGAPAAADPLPTADNVNYRPAILGERWLYRLWYRLRLPLPVQWVTGPLDLFHSPDFVLPPVAGGIPTLLTIHDLSFVHYPETFPAALVSYLNSVVPWSIGRATHLLADSESTREDLINTWQVPAEKITVLYGGVEPTFSPVTGGAERRAILAKYAIGDVPYILSVGTVQPRKNYRMLIRAFKGVTTKRPHNLVIAGGNGWLYEKILGEADRQGVADRVQFVGFVDDSDLPALYTGAALFVLPSLYEGFGLPILEAMGCGVPVITSDASSLPELARTAEGAEAAVQLSPHDESAWTEAIDQLLSNPDRCGDLVANGFKQSSRFSWTETAHQLRALYQRMAQAHM